MHNALISACETSKQPGRALELFEPIQRHGVLPDTITYSALMSVCENGKQPGRALELFEPIQRHCVVPDTITYSARLCNGKGWYLTQSSTTP